MRLSRSARLRTPLAAALAATLAACADAPTRLVSPLVADQSPAALASSQAGEGTLLSCAVATPATATAVIGPNGGTIAVDGASIRIPGGAVPVPTSFTVTVPATPFVEVDIRAAGFDHYVFRHPVFVTLSYARCDLASLDGRTLGASWVDSQTRALLGVKNAVDDKKDQQVKLLTDHLSGYAVVYRNGEPADSTGRAYGSSQP
jgi:hypothetical protein